MKLKALILFLIQPVVSAIAENHSDCNLVLASAGEFTAGYKDHLIISRLNGKSSIWFSPANNDNDDNMFRYLISNQKLTTKLNSGKLLNMPKFK